MSSKDEFIDAARLLSPQVRSTCPIGPSPELYYKHHIFPVKLFSLLLTTLQAKPDHDERSIKLIVNLQKKLLLAQAGPHGTYVPSHKNMASSLMKPSVLSAGLMYLGPQGEVIGLSNENNDFELSVKSLLWPLIIMHLMNNVPIDGSLSIIGSHGASFELTLTDREDIIENLALQTLQSLLHANRDTRVIIREGAYTRNGLFPSCINEAFAETPHQDILKSICVEC